MNIHEIFLSLLFFDSLDFISKILQTHFETKLSKTQKCVQGWENAQKVKKETKDEDNEAPSDKTCYQLIDQSANKHENIDRDRGTWCVH